MINTTAHELSVCVDAIHHATVIVEAEAYKVYPESRRDQWRTWKSGVLAPVYCNCRLLLARPTAREHIENALVKLTEEEFPQTDFVAGLATAGISWGSAIARKLGLPYTTVRQARKTHGFTGIVDSEIGESSSVLLVDDLLASGGSVRRCVDDMRIDGIPDPMGIVSIANWGFDAMHRNTQGIRKASLVEGTSLVRAARALELIDASFESKLIDFYSDPGSYQWT